MARLRRWRYLPAAVMALWGLTTTTTAAPSSSSSSGSSSSFSVKCWRVETSSSTLSIARAAVDDACPVSVDVADLTAPFAPGDDVPAIWTVTLKSAGDSTNALAMPLPPPLTTNPGAQTPAQISATYVRACESVATCDPASAAATSSAVRTSNFSAPGEALSFSVLQAVKFDREGVFPIAAFVSVRDALDSGVAYVFAAYATVTIKAAAARAPTRTEGVVRCRMTRQSALNATLDADASVSESSNCELRVALAPLQVVRPGGATPVQWVATLDRHDDAGIHLPSPIPPMQIEDGGDAYEIVASYVKLCADTPDASCDEYTPLESLAGFAAAGPASFSPASGNVTFTSAPVALATAGRHPAMLHMVVAGPARRYDFVYYLELLATPAEVASTATAYKTDAATAYCWDVLADATRADVNSSSVAAEANASACPYVSTLTMPATPPAAGERFNLSWSLSANPNYSALASPLATPVNLSTVYDASSKTYVSLPALNVYACGNGTACTPFSPDKTLLMALPARSLATADGSDTTVIRADGLTVPTEGNFTILVHSVLPNGARRVDTAVYGALRVALAAAPPSAGAKPEEAKSHTVTYVVVPVVGVVAVAIVVFGAIWLRRRRQRQRMEKMVQFGLFGAPAGRSGQGTVLHNTESRGSFPSGESGRGSFSFLRVQASQPSPVGFETPREGSLSYDPYHRTSFQDMSLAESSLSFAFTDNERPSTMSNLTNDDTKGVDV